jgi:hypothetical protein
MEVVALALRHYSSVHGFAPPPDTPCMDLTLAGMIRGIFGWFWRKVWWRLHAYVARL